MFPCHRTPVMKILAIERELSRNPAGTSASLLQSEARRVWELYQSGVIREAYFRGDRPEAVLILESNGPEEAFAELRTLPLVREGVIDFELIPLAPYPGFARLFGH